MLLGGRPQGGHDFYPEGVCAHLFSPVTCWPAQAVAGHNCFPPIFVLGAYPGIYAQYVWWGINPRVDRY
jgi:hypothetical protein